MDNLAEHYIKAGKPVVFLEQNVDTPIDESRKNRWWRSYLAWGGNPGGATLPWTMTDSGYNTIEGPVNEALGKSVINDSLARPPKADISAQVQRVGNRYHFEIQVTNLSGVTLSFSNEATVYAIVYETVSPDYVNYLTSRYVRAVASSGISSLANGATASFSLDTSDLSGVDWGRLHPVVLVDYRPGGSSGYYDMLQAAFEYSPTPLEVRKYAEPGTVNAGDPLTYTIQVVNTSEVNMMGGDFTVTDNLPPQVTYTGPTFWTPDTLSPGSIWETTFVVTVSASYSGTLTNEVVVTNTQGASTVGYATVNLPPEKVYLPLVLKNPHPTYLWEVVFEEDFEGTFPGSWVVDGHSTGYEWGKRSCKPYEGSNSGWAVGGGTSGAGLSCGTHTVTETLETTMTYGPFSLSDASQAQLEFKYWFNTDVSDPTDLWFCADFSTNGTTWLEESCIYGNSGGWRDATFDLSKYGAVGADQVWIRIVAYYPYSPDLTLTDGGIFIDNVVVRKR